MKNWRLHLTAGRKSLAKGKIKREIFQVDALFLFVIDMMPLNHIFRKSTGRYKFTK